MCRNFKVCYLIIFYGHKFWLNLSARLDCWNSKVQDCVHETSAAEEMVV